MFCEHLDKKCLDNFCFRICKRSVLKFVQGIFRTKKSLETKEISLVLLLFFCLLTFFVFLEAFKGIRLFFLGPICNWWFCFSRRKAEARMCFQISSSFTCFRKESRKKSIKQKQKGTIRLWVVFNYRPGWWNKWESWGCK